MAFLTLFFASWTQPAAVAAAVVAVFHWGEGHFLLGERATAELTMVHGMAG